MNPNIIVFALILVISLSACNKEKIEALESQNNELQQEISETHASIDDYVGTLISIQESLERIKEKENIIKLKATEALEETSREKILNDLSLLEKVMEENRNTLTKLQKELKNSKGTLTNFQKLTESLKSRLAEKEEAIGSLRKEVEGLIFKNKTLQANLVAYEVKTDTLQRANERLSSELQLTAETLENKTNELNTGYLALGTARELYEKKIITKEGGVLGLGSVELLNTNAVEEKFNKINISQMTSIPLMAKKVDLVTMHPTDSYKIRMEEGSNIATVLEIIDPQKFWKASKFLVVRVN